jgi:hypothetical protein
MAEEATRRGVIAHVVLFRPKSDLSTDSRTAFVDALRRAIDEIPDIVRARVGRRVKLGTAYDALPGQDYPFVAILEFADRNALAAYLAHPVHQALGEQFYLAAESALAIDYEFVDQVTANALI